MGDLRLVRDPAVGIDDQGRSNQRRGLADVFAGLEDLSAAELPTKCWFTSSSIGWAASGQPPSYPGDIQVFASTAGGRSHGRC
jgi:hypothetical protein